MKVRFLSFGKKKNWDIKLKDQRWSFCVPSLILLTDFLNVFDFWWTNFSFPALFGTLPYCTSEKTFWRNILQECFDKLWRYERNVFRQTVSLKFFKGCLPQILLGPFLKTLTHMTLCFGKFEKKSLISLILRPWKCLYIDFLSFPKESI